MPVGLLAKTAGLSNAEKVDAPGRFADAVCNMEIESSSAIEFFFPNPSLVQVYFEAIANSLDAKASEISICIEIKKFNPPEGFEISITDNGDGFTDESFERIRKILRKKDAFHKGLGRLVFLNYFSQITVDSVFESTRRTFVYSENFDGKYKIEKLNSAQTKETTLKFTGFKGASINTYNYLKPEILKEKIIEHFLPTLLDRQRNDLNFKININLHTEESNDQREFISSDSFIVKDDLPKLTSIIIKDATLDAFDGVEMLYQIKPGPGERSLQIAISIDGRTIPISLLQPNSVPWNYSVIFLFISKMFKANPSRQKLELPDGISESNLNHVLRREVGKILAEKIPTIGEKNAVTRSDFEKQFPHLSGFFEENTAGLIDKDDAIDIAQRRFFKEEKAVLQCEKLDDVTYEKSLELSSRALTEYILYREKIIRRMKEMTPDNSEDEIHELIVPKYKQFKKENFIDGIYRNNAWLLDDKFMSFQTILSEARMGKIIQAITLKEEISDDAKRPDITMIFSGEPENTAAVDVVVVEIKKKTDDEEKNQYVINQLLARARKLAAHCPNIERIWYYAVININEEMKDSLIQQNWATFFSAGQVYYQEFPTKRPNGTIVLTPIFVMSFDAIVGDAESRNRTFLEILRNGMKRYQNTNIKEVQNKPILPIDANQ